MMFRDEIARCTDFDDRSLDRCRPCRNIVGRYPTVASALEALQKRADVRISRQGEWTIIEDRASLTLWSFTPERHPAHPAVVRRKIVEERGKLYVQMNVLCEAAKAACDNLVADFNKLNQQMADDLNRRKQAN